MSDRCQSPCWLLTAGSLLALLLAGCGSDSPASPNLLIITLDTARADRIGPESGLTPALDALADRGVRFTHAFTEVPITLPAHATLFTGLYPPQHGVRNNAPDALGAVPTLANRLRDSGYATAAFVSCEPLASGSGIERGFNHFDDRLPDRSHEYLFRERAGRDTIEAASSWIVKHRARWGDEVPFFVWVHHFGPHQPYAPPPPWQATYRNAPYDGEIRAADEEIGELLALLRSEGLLENTLVVFASDHGEGLGEFEETHGYYLYDPTLRIPLIVAGPGVPEGVVSDRPTGLVDVVPTALELLGQEVPKRLAGASMLSTARVRLYSESHYCYRNFGWSPLSALTDSQYKLVEGGSEHRLFARRPDAPGFDETLDRARELEDLTEEKRRALAQQLAALEAQAEEWPDPESVPRDLSAIGYLSGVPAEAPDARARRSPLGSESIVSGLDRARELLASRSPNAALSLLTELEGVDPENPEIPFWRGRALAKISQELSADAARGVTSARPAAQSSAREAEAAFERAVSLRPSYHDAWLLAVWQRIRLGEFEEAHASLHRMLTSERARDAKTWELFARLLATPRAELAREATNELYDRDAAKTAAEAAVRFDPQNGSATRLLDELSN
ncbi:MAG: sulfatase-like hydrolase/transferase [Planctomycetota bacterium]